MLFRQSKQRHRLYNPPGSAVDSEGLPSQAEAEGLLFANARIRGPATVVTRALGQFQVSGSSLLGLRSPRVRCFGA